MDQLSKRKRSGNWTEEDKILLKELVKERVSEIENKNTDTNTNQRKKKAWLELEESFNNMCTGDKRNLSQLKSQWTLTKIQAKKEMSLHRKEVNKTGGGPQPHDITMSANDISIWLPNEFIVDTNEFDSDVVEISHGLETNTSIHIDTMSSDVIALPETFDKSSLQDKQKKNTQENASKRKSKIAVNSQTVANDNITKLSDLETKCRQELHLQQMENEKKRSRNLDLKYEVLQEKLKFLRGKNNG